MITGDKPVVEVHRGRVQRKPVVDTERAALTHKLEQRHFLIDVVIESGLEAYDIQALIPIIQGSGGIVTNWQGKPADHGGQVVACGDKELHKQVIELLNL